jgi:hypothetical protein
MSKEYPGWCIPAPFEIDDIVEFTEEKKSIGFPDGLFKIVNIDLDPENWIATQPITVWLLPLEMLRNSHARLNINEKGEILISCNRYGKAISDDLRKETQIFRLNYLGRKTDE